MILIDFGGDIKGDSTVADHDKWIPVTSFQLGVGRGIGSVSGGAERETSTPSISEVTFSKGMDIASPDLMGQALYGGDDLKDLVVHFIQTGKGDKIQVFLKYKFFKPMISGYSISSGGDRPVESISINFTKYTMVYSSYSGTTQTNSTPVGYDLATSKSATDAP